MHLQKITYNGFKSFADKTVILLEKGMTAIVGPNGCGKSNIADGIRWVLGEQSAKALRGNKMQDVIFEGSAHRKAHNFCEVVLLFTDCEKELGTDFHQVEISRKVTREGSSDYRINGKASRLKDIQRLFMDTGVGQASYSFMAQGQITQIIDANPAERRQIFEEAAGITRYKAQRKEALNKLSLVDQNLSRVTDVVEEVNRQISSLKRQVTKALRYQRIEFRLTHLDLAHHAFQYGEIATAIKGQKERQKLLSIDLNTLQEELKENESSLETKKKERTESSDSLQQNQQNIFELRSQKGDSENQVDLYKNRIQDHQKQLVTLAQEEQALSQEHNQLEEKAQNEADTKQTQLNLLQDSDANLQEKNQLHNHIQAKLQEQQKQIRQTKQDILVIESTLTRLRANCTRYQVDLKSYQVKHAGLTEKVALFRNTAETASATSEKTRQIKENRANEKAQQEETLETLKREAKQLRTDFREQQIRIQEKERAFASLSAQKSTLQKLQDRFEGFGEGAKAILSGKLKQISAQDIQPLSKSLQVPPTHLTALETLLGEALDTLVFSEQQAALTTIDQLTTRKLGKAYLKIPFSPSSPSDKRTLPNYLHPVSEIVGIDPKQDAELLQNIFYKSYFANNLQDFLTFWQDHPSFDFIWVATPQGELLDCRGILYGGKDTGENHSFLHREKDIHDLSEKAKALHSDLQKQHQNSKTIQHHIDQKEQQIEQQQQRFSETSQELSQLLAEERSLQQEIEINQKRANQSQSELEKFESTHQKTQEQMHQAENALQEAESNIAEKRTLIIEQEERLQKIEQEREQYQEGFTQARLALAEKKQQLAFIDRNLSAIQQKKKEIQSRRERTEMEKEQAQQNILEFSKNILEHQNRSEQLQRTLSNALESLQIQTESLKKLENSIQENEQTLHKLLEKRRDLDRQHSQQEMELSKNQSQLHFLSQTVRNQYHLELDALDWKTRLWKADEKFQQKISLDELEETEPLTLKTREAPRDPTPEDLQNMDKTDWHSIQQEVQLLRQRLQSIGSVNLGAIEEYSTLKERYQFLKNQSDDLWKAKDELLLAIDEINQTSRTLFEDTFTQIRKNFSHTFDALFGGGQADLKLLDDNDILDSGIEIIASPPGTRLKNLILLSGGQKTMTALSLLFAIYMVKPSPFCVLDELDAPLDDANIGRFTQMLRQFLSFSQFLIITHNKRTISAADSIYGATMQEKGVTDLISLKFDAVLENKETTAI